jgi:hypothetical protein
MSWKRNPYKHLYQWIIHLKDEGYSHERIMEAFEKCPATMMDTANENEVKLADVIIRHALGKADDSEIEEYCFSTEIIDFEKYTECTEGYLFLAKTPETEEDFYFLVEKEVLGNVSSIEEVSKILTTNKDEVRNLILYKSHTQSPYGVSGMPFEVAKAKLTWRDFNS